MKYDFFVKTNQMSFMVSRMLQTRSALFSVLTYPDDI